MDLASILYLGVTSLFIVIFVVIVVRTYSRKNRDKNETAKYHMLDDD
ncbi:CcoQ/FixQ family Cbb3-type cytochrome c oxidase assembly chaperone [Geopsychrobacter electrodiphilus]|nr:CcoQ/FixQ family Cbb3-type cytochrome c oxidase assembly chaperone [Geopsychrobacter electrodiphilus]